MTLHKNDVLKHSRKIKALKIILILFVCILLLSVSIAPFISSKHESLHMVFGDIEENTRETENGENDKHLTKITMPKFYGIDLKDRPFTIDADEGIQIDEKTATLKNVYGDIKLDEKTFIEMKSSKAVINLDNKELNLKDNVKVKINDKYVIETKESKFSPTDNSLSGNSGINVLGDQTNISADSFIITNDYNNISFKKNVKMVIQND